MKTKLLTIMRISVFTVSAFADHHAMKGDKSKKEMKKMEMMKKKEHMKKEMERKGMWKREDCKKVSETSGAYLYFSGQAFKKRTALEKDGNQVAADEAFREAMALAELAANFAKNFETYCKR